LQVPCADCGREFDVTPYSEPVYRNRGKSRYVQDVGKLIHQRDFTR